MAAPRSIWTGVVMYFVVSGCAQHSAPAGFLLSPDEAQRASFGGWIDITYISNAHDGASGVERVTGELFAASADSLWVRQAQGGVVVPTSSVRDGQFVAYDSKSNQVGGATVIGVISTISNGVFLVLTAPMWAIGGSVATAKQSKIPITEFPNADWEDLRRFSRFPQGLPNHVDWRSLPPRER